MGNNQLKEKEEYVTFEVIQEALGLNNPVLFKKYLIEVFNDLANSVNKQNKKYLTRMAFYDYIKLPIFIAEKLFMSFAKSNDQGLCLEEFVENFYNLYMGSFEETINIIFKILDFNKDGIIQKDDVKIVLSYLPLNEINEEKSENKEKIENQESTEGTENTGNNDKNDLVMKVFGTQMKSLKEIDEIISSTFDEYNGKMNLEQFTKIVTEKNSEIFLQILCFLYNQIPFNSKNIDELKTKYNLINDDEYEMLSESYRKKKKSNSIKIKAPKRSTFLSPARKFLKKFELRKYSLNEEEKANNLLSPNKNKKHNSIDSTSKESEKDVSLNSSKSNSSNQNNNNEIKVIDDLNNKKTTDPYNKNIDIVRMDNENYLDNKTHKLLNEDKNIKEIVQKSKNRYTSPTKYLQDKSYLNHLAISNILINTDNNKLDNQLGPINENEDENENNKTDKNSLKQIMDNINNNTNYENWIYKITENGKLRKYYLVLVNKDTYYYKTEKKTDFVGMHNLSGCYVQESNQQKVIDSTTYYSFEIYCKNKSKTKTYYTSSEKICKEFVEKIKEAIGYVKFSDLYEMKEVIGKGKFGVVNLGIHKKTGQQVAIKILNKETIKTVEDKELVQIEIGILKLCHHPNIVRLLDHLENNDFIYIVTEYIEGGTLGQYFKKKEI